MAHGWGPSTEGLHLWPLGKRWFPKAPSSHFLMLTCLTSHFKHILRFQNGQSLDLYRRLWTQRALSSLEVSWGLTSSGATVSASGAWDSMGPLALPTQPCAHSLLHPHHLEGSSLHSFANKCAHLCLPPLPPHRPRTHHCISGWGSSLSVWSKCLHGEGRWWPRWCCPGRPGGGAWPWGLSSADPALPTYPPRDINLLTYMQTTSSPSPADPGC